MEVNKLENYEIYECTFCNDFQPSKDTVTKEFLSTYPELADKGQVLDKWGNFYLVPDIAPITTDHLLLISNRHVLSMSMLNKDEKLELMQIIEILMRRMKINHPTSEILIYEHGAGRVNGQVIRCGGCARTDHAHLHFVPIAKKVRPGSILVQLVNELNFKLNVLKGDSILDMFKQIKDKPYLLISLKGANYILRPKDRKIPSQILRKLVQREFIETDEKKKEPLLWQDCIVFENQRCKNQIKKSINFYNYRVSQYEY